MKKILLKIAGALLLLPALYFVVVILTGTITNYSPQAIENISSIEEEFTIDESDTYTVLIWNIGYAGLGAEMDFFYDGGKKVRDSKENVETNLTNIGALLEQNDWIDFVLLQEVDHKSKRSYKGNQVEYFNSKLSSHYSFSCLNYKVGHVPVPFFRPMGKVEAGLLSFTTNIPSEVNRHKFPGNYSWPKSVFMLDRCFMEMRFPLGNGKELLIISTHNSAYDNGSLRKQQMAYLKDFLLEEEVKGNYILVGGDWNQCPPRFKPDFGEYIFDTINLSYVEEGYPAENWSFHYDETIPTNRRVITTYNQSTSPVTLIDYFLASPNIEVVRVEGVNLDFENADHNPVLLTFRLKDLQ